MSAAYLIKTEPDAYSIADLERDKETIWDGVANNQALIHLRAMKRGDLLVVYHTGDERAAVGTASVLSVDLTDHKNPKVKIKFKKRLKRPRTLAEIKAAPMFAESPLVRIGRLGVVPLTQGQADWLIGR